MLALSLLSFEAIKPLLVGLDDMGNTFDHTHNPLYVFAQLPYLLAHFSIRSSFAR